MGTSPGTQGSEKRCETFIRAPGQLHKIRDTNRKQPHVTNCEELKGHLTSLSKVQGENSKRDKVQSQVTNRKDTFYCRFNSFPFFLSHGPN